MQPEVGNKGFQGGCVLVTGASGGLGGAVARAFAATGARVALHAYLGHQRVGEVAMDITARGGVCRVFPADLSRAEEARGLALRVADWAGGAVGGMVHAAGMARDSPVVSLQEEDWDAVLAVHLHAVVHLLRGLPVADGGFVTLIGSGATHGRKGQAAYAAAKSGVAALGEVLAREFGVRGMGGVRGVRINTVVPGPLETPFWHTLSPQAQEQLKGAGALPEFNDVASVAEFILQLSRMTATSGQTLCISSRVEGGL
ncbi:MAG: SDR family oxidoreductase [Nitrospirota bacterium]|nr:SDR family oxidoreductase [Nitrospirota bacterium]